MPGKSSNNSKGIYLRSENQKSRSSNDFKFPKVKERKGDKKKGRNSGVTAGGTEGLPPSGRRPYKSGKVSNIVRANLGGHIKLSDPRIVQLTLDLDSIRYFCDL